MRLALVLVVTVAACSTHNTPPPASPAPAASSSPASPGPPPTAAPTVSAEQFCEHFEKVAGQCEQFANLRANLRMNPTTCVADMRPLLAAPQDHKFMVVLARCVVAIDGCDEVHQCLAAGMPDPTDPQALRACGDVSQNSAEHAVGIPKTAWDHRNGAQVTRFREARSTKADPIEMCGVTAATHWLTTLRCDDSSQPIKSVDDAEQARPGNVGQGGHCHSMIDRYVVPCPEARYELFIDAYVCSRPD